MHKQAFTLVEVLVSIVILSFISASSYFAFVVAGKAVNTINNRSIAINLAQKSLEEIRSAASIDFDKLEQYAFKETFEDFPDFRRVVCISSEGNSTELKRADVTIIWQENNQEKELPISILLSRPPDALSGNIHGTVINMDTLKGVGGAQVKATNVLNPDLSFATTTDSEGFYTFNFNLKPGKWKLSVVHEDYYEYNHSVEINISDSEDEEVVMEIDPRPLPAYIRGKVINTNTGEQVLQGVTLLQQAKNVYSVKNTQQTAPFEFKVSFKDDSAGKQCFTLVTSVWGWTIEKGYGLDWEIYVGGFPYREFRLCGNFCDSHSWGKEYNYRGWSSAIVREDGSIKISNPWEGSAQTDRICVNSGDEIDITIPLVEIPKAVLDLSVYGADGNLCTQVMSAVYWHDDSSHFTRLIPTQSWGSYSHYQAEIPAAQEIFPNDSKYYLRLYVQGWAVTIDYCGVQGVKYTDKEVRIGPVFKGDIIKQDIIFGQNQDIKRGSAQGYVIDAKTGKPLEGVTVEITGAEGRQVKTDSSGFWGYTCADKCYHPIEIGEQSLKAYHQNYHGLVTTISPGNMVGYVYTHKPHIKILENEITTYPLIKLYPQSWGVIKGIVVDAGTDKPLKGVTVKHSGSRRGADWGDIFAEQMLTNENGEFEFRDAAESWPPPDLSGDPYYQQNVENHTLKVSYTDNYYPEEVSGIVVRSGQVVELKISLSQKGQM